MHLDLNNKRNVKFAVVGSASAGKSELITGYTHHQGVSGMDFGSKLIGLDAQTLSLKFWNTSGRKRFHSVSRSYFQDTQGVVLLFDPHDRNSFDYIQKSMRSIREEIGVDARFILIACSKDLEKSPAVSYEEAEKFAEDNAIPFIELQVDNAAAVDAAFDLAAHRILTLEGLHGEELQKAKENLIKEAYDIFLKKVEEFQAIDIPKGVAGIIAGYGVVDAHHADQYVKESWSSQSKNPSVATLFSRKVSGESDSSAEQVERYSPSR